MAIDATLRLVPSFLGASPIFALILLVGYVYGPRFGFVMGSLTLLLSAAITAGVGPWLPFQMLCAGWVGVAAGWLPKWKSARAELSTAVAFGAVTGFAYGALMNLYSWPFAAPGLSDDVGLYWSLSLLLPSTGSVRIAQSGELHRHERGEDRDPHAVLGRDHEIGGRGERLYCEQPLRIAGSRSERSTGRAPACRDVARRQGEEPGALADPISGGDRAGRRASRLSTTLFGTPVEPDVVTTTASPRAPRPAVC